MMRPVTVILAFVGVAMILQAFLPARAAEPECKTPAVVIALVLLSLPEQILPAHRDGGAIAGNAERQ